MRRRKPVITGTLRVTRGGTAFVAPEGGGPEILLRRAGGHGALPGDVVEVVTSETKWGMRGRVVDVVEARTSGALGVVEKSGRGFRVATDRRDLPPWFNVGRAALGDAEVGDRVWVEVLRDGSGAATANCVIREVLGSWEDPSTDHRAVALRFGLQEEFSSQATLEALRLSAPDHLLAGRRDFRGELVFTIDPEDAKDYDDALSVVELGSGLFEVGVHIADVSSFVLQGTALDLEAKERGASVYLCGGVLPMLPPALSEGLCSLEPDVDRFTLSVVFTLDNRGRVRDRKFIRGLIRSKARLTYRGAQAYLNGESDPDPLCDSLKVLARLAACLADVRRGKGALDLDVPEKEVVLDERGIPTQIGLEEKLDSHHIVEEFMLLANETVAAEAESKRVPFVYREHPRPKFEKLEELALSLADLGVRFSPGSVRRGRDLEVPLAAISNERLKALGSYLILRAMERARYAPGPSHHFGLASDCYCHFTSPIRRYPDLYNHRGLSSVLFPTVPRAANASHGVSGAAGTVKNEAAKAGSSEPWDPELISESSSEAERRAESAERELIEIKCIRFMEGRLGECFSGLVTAVMARGYTIGLDDYPVEGFAPKPALRRRARGREGLCLGDRVTVRVARADPLQVELELAIVKKGRYDADKLD